MPWSPLLGGLLSLVSLVASSLGFGLTLANLLSLALGHEASRLGWGLALYGLSSISFVVGWATFRTPRRV